MTTTLSTEALLRLTVTALMAQTGERQLDLGTGIGLSQTQVSRKQKGLMHWSLDDCDRLASHYGMTVLDLLAGPTHAASRLSLHRLTPGRGIQTTLPPAPATPETPAAPSEPAPAVPAAHSAAQPAAAPVPAASAPQASSTPAGPQATPVAAEAPAPGQAPVRTPEQPAAAPSPAMTRRPPAGTTAAPLMDRIGAAVKDALITAEGDTEAAQALLIKQAIPDVMELFRQSRIGGRYEHSDFPPTGEILKKKSQKGADDIWEGRPKWRNTAFIKAAKASDMPVEVHVLDVNAAYLSAMTTHLPIGQLQHDTSGIHHTKRAGVHRIEPPAWEHPDLPNPLGARQEPGPLWVTEPTLRLLLRCHREDLCEAPVILESWTSGSSEALLKKLRETLRDVRKEAIEKGDELTLEYVKSMYSKFVSTIGESTKNRDIRRPDWMHIIRSQSFANLWLKARKAHAAGLTVVEISGTDELQVAGGDWRKVFPEGRSLAEMKEKDGKSYTLGGSQ
ncbi:acyltransferase [Streptomyces aureoversilis]|uniref:Acyltransferase n=1 Tax=Streptomyces aureoversilis TaxID=67277 RepID=A0ABW0A838_9ACTN